MALPLTKRRKLGEILLSHGAVRQDELDRALAAQGTKVMPIGSTLISLGICDEVEVTLALAEQWGVPGVDLKASTIATEVLAPLPQEVAISHHVLPLAFQGQSVQVAFANPGQSALVDEIAFAYGRQALPFVAPKCVVQDVVKAAFDAKQKGQALWKGPRSKFDAPELVTLQPQESSVPPGIEVEPELTAGSLDAIVQSMPEPPPRTGNEAPRVLAVDDEVEILDLIEKALTRKGIEVFKATRGREALELLRASNPDLVLLDAMLPEIHGFEICHKIKQSQQYRHVPVIIISAIYTGWNFVQDVKRIYGADDYMAKPFRIVELVRRVEETLARSKGRPRSPEVQHALKEAAKECVAAAELFRSGQVQESMDAAQRAVEADPFDPRGHFLLGMALHRLGHIYEAISEYERVVELAPAMFSALKNLAVLYEQQGFRAKAVEMWMRAVAQSPSDAVRQTIKAHLIGLI